MSHQSSTIDQCSIISLPTRHNGRQGALTAVDNIARTLPFTVRRTYYLYDVPGGESRGGHSHRELHEFLVAAAGSFTVTIDDGSNRRTVMLNRPDCGLHIAPGIWRTLDDFSSGAVCLVLASDRYSEPDYIRSYDEFLGSKGYSE